MIVLFLVRGGGIVFGTNDGSGYSTKMKISDSGNVGIGNSTPTYNLEVVDSTNNSLVAIRGLGDTAYAGLYAQTNTGNGQFFKLSSGYSSYGGSGSINIYNSEDKPITFYQKNVERMRIDSSGHIGIGISKPVAPLQVFTNSNKYAMYLGDNSNNHLRLAGTAGSSLDYSLLQSMNGANTPSSLVLQRDGGNVGIGISTPKAPLQVMGATAPNDVSLANQVYIAKFLYRTPGSTQFGLAMKSLKEAAHDTWAYSGVRLTSVVDSDIYSIDNAYNNLAWIDFYSETYNNGLRFGTGNTERMRINSSGNITMTENLSVAGTITGTVVAPSDIRYKKNISNIENPIAKIGKINGCYYDWKRDEFENKNFTDERQVGVIAQEVEKVLPEVVKTDDEGYKSVSYDKLTALLIEAVKTQQKQIDELKKELADLKKSK